MGVRADQWTPAPGIQAHTAIIVDSLDTSQKNVPSRGEKKGRATSVERKTT
jgi:hypothetical protein